MADGSEQREQPSSPQNPAPVAAPSMPSPSGYSNHAIHLVRTAQQMNLTLSQMADSKASLLMGATFVVFTIAIGQASRGALTWSLSVLAIFAFLSAMSAVYAVLPSVSRPRSYPTGPQANKLFFGHFTDLEEDEWTRCVLADLKADETVFRTMLHDLYQNGQILRNKKYRFLGIAYRLFIAGLCLTLATFTVEQVLARPG